jgi:hypothetical protein
VTTTVTRQVEPGHEVFRESLLEGIAAAAHWSIVAEVGTALGCLELFGQGAMTVAGPIGCRTIASPLAAFHAHQYSATKPSKLYCRVGPRADDRR